MGVKVKISEAIKNEILRQEIAEGFHSSMQFENDSINEELPKRASKIRNTYSKRSNVGDYNAPPDLEDIEKEIQKRKAKFSGGGLNPKQVFDLYKKKSQQEKADIVERVVGGLFPYFFKNNVYVDFAYNKNLKNQKLTLDILQYLAGNQSKSTFNSILNQIFDTYVEVLLRYFFSGKKAIQITGNKDIDIFILSEVRKGLLADMKNNEIPKYFEQIPLYIKKYLLTYFKRNKDLPTILLSLDSDVENQDKETEDLFEESLNEIETYREKEKNRRANAVSTAIIKRASIVFDKMDAKEPVLNEILDLISDMLLRDNTTLNDNISNVVSKYVEKKIEQLKSGKLMISKLMGTMLDRNVGSGASIVQAAFRFNKETMDLIRIELANKK